MIAAPRYRECVETKLDSATRRFEKLVLKLEFGILPNACAMTRMGVRVGLSKARTIPKQVLVADRQLKEAHRTGCGVTSDMDVGELLSWLEQYQGKI
jgi:hypothetical protein